MEPAYAERKPSRAHPVPQKPRILLAVCGSVAAIKLGNLYNGLSQWADVKVILTMASRKFIDEASLPRGFLYYADENEWSSWWKLGDSVLHIELCRWADLMLIAPLSANTLGKIAGGLADNLLTSVMRAWDYNKPFFAAPAMNTLMWNNPFTERHFMLLDELGMTLIPPVSEMLGSGESVTGAMAEPSVIIATVRLFLEKKKRESTVSKSK